MDISPFLLAKSAPIWLPLASVFFKNIHNLGESLLKDLLEKGSELAADHLAERLEKTLENKSDILAHIGSDSFLRFTGVVMEALIRRFAEQSQMKSEKKELLRLAGLAVEGWLMFLKMGGAGITDGDWRVFLRTEEDRARSLSYIPNLSGVPFKRFFNWHVRLSPDTQIKLSEWLVAELPRTIPVSLLKEDRAAREACIQVMLENLFDIHDELQFVREDLVLVRRKTDGMRDSPEWDLREYARLLRLHCLRIPLTDEYGAEGMDRITLRSVFVPQNVRPVDTTRLANLALPSEDIAATLRGEIHHLPEAKREHAEHHLKLHSEQPAQPATAAFFSPGERGHIILGDAGVGKTSLVRHLVLEWIDSSLSSVSGTSPPLPLYIELKAYADTAGSDRTLDLLDYLHESIHAPCKMPRGLCAIHLRTGKAYLVLDGLDEVPQPSLRLAIAKQAQTWVSDGARVILTSRIVGFEEKNWNPDACWRRWQLLEFDDAQRQLFLDKAAPLLWPGAALASQRLADLHRRFRAFPHVESLSHNPLLLTLIVLMQRNGRLGESRVAIYQEASRWLLDRWEQRLHIKEHLIVTEATKHRIVRCLALRIYEEKLAQHYGENLFPLSLLEDVIRKAVDPCGINPVRADELVELLPRLLRERHSLLCWVGGEYYAFLHRSFMEFFAAQAWKLEMDKADLTPAAVHDQLFIAIEENNTPRWRHPRYENLIPLYIGLLDDLRAKQMLEQLWSLLKGEKKDEALLLTANCFAEIQERINHTELQGRLLAALEILACFEGKKTATTFFVKNRINQPMRQRAVRAYAVLVGGSEIGRNWLWQIMENGDLNEDVRASAIEQLTELTGTDDTLRDRLLALMSDRKENGQIRYECLNILAKFWSGDEHIRKAFLTLLSDRNENWRLREHSLEALVKYWAAADWLRDPFLALLSDRDESWQLRQQSLEIVIKYWGGATWLRDSVLSLLADRQEDGLLRQQSFDVLVINCGAAEWLRELLLALLKDQQERGQLRQQSLETLVKYWRATDWLQEPLLNLTADPLEDGWLRRQVIKALGDHWGATNCLRSVLLFLVVNRQGNWLVLSQARDVLEKFWPDDVEIKSAMRKLIL